MLIGEHGLSSTIMRVQKRLEDVCDSRRKFTGNSRDTRLTHTRIGY